MGGDNANSGSYPGGNGTSGRFLLREDDVMQLEFNTNGLFSRSKPRRLILLNDLLVCVAVNGRSSEVDPSTSTSTSANERLTLKWAVPVSDVEVSSLFPLCSPTLLKLNYFKKQQKLVFTFPYLR